ncbi:sporulation protein YjcZ [Neobacillus piezotolerans]|uniref:Sporulation protein YjcZ n=1 Tax=Neobacillus piezotolerans TaxID=2259171 RepID=A0A3D8GQ84_9BACI|nr:YjcZ family sporulation protein [Neobacillus piezotolerans]RDU36442.1 sporulation protein YjcZ [Neobacillus piezotolerans]
MYGYGGYCGYAQPTVACCAPTQGIFGNGFVLIVVLFILLVIIGACCWFA